MQLSLFRRNFTWLYSSGRKENKEENSKSREYECNMLIRFSVVYLPLKIFSSNLEKSEKKIFFFQVVPFNLHSLGWENTTSPVTYVYGDMTPCLEFFLRIER